MYSFKGTVLLTNIFHFSGHISFGFEVFQQSFFAPLTFVCWRHTYISYTHYTKLHYTTLYYTTPHYLHLGDVRAMSVQALLSGVKNRVSARLLLVLTGIGLASCLLYIHFLPEFLNTKPDLCLAFKGQLKRQCSN